MQRHLEKIESLLNNYCDQETQKVPQNPLTVVKKIINLNESDRSSILEELYLVNKNLPFDILNLFVEMLRSTIRGTKCYPFIIAPEYMRVKSLIRKRLDSSCSDDIYGSLSDISKLSLKEREKYREHQMELNIKYDIYSDIVRYIDKEIKNDLEVQKIRNSLTNYKFETGVEKIYNTISNDINEIIMNNILENKKVYVGLAVVRQERINQLFDKMNDFYNSNIY